MSFMYNFITRPFRDEEPTNAHTTPAPPATIRTTQPSQRAVFSDILRAAQPPKRKRSTDDDTVEAAEAAAPKRVRFTLLKSDKTTAETTKTVQGAVKKAMTARDEHEKESPVHQAVFMIHRQMEGEMAEWQEELKKQLQKEAMEKAEAIYKKKFEDWKKKEMVEDIRQICRKKVTKLVEECEAGLENWETLRRNKDVEEELTKRWNPLHKKYVDHWKVADRIIKQNLANGWTLYDEKEKLQLEEERIAREKALLEQEILDRRAEIVEEKRQQEASVVATRARIEEEVRAQYNQIQRDLVRNAKTKSKQMSPQTLKNLNVSLEEEPLTPKSQLKVDRAVERQMRNFTAEIVAPYEQQLLLERGIHFNEMQEVEKKWERKGSVEFRRLLEICEKAGDDAKKFAEYRALARKAGVIVAGQQA